MYMSVLKVHNMSSLAVEDECKIKLEDLKTSDEVKHLQLPHPQSIPMSYSNSMPQKLSYSMKRPAHSCLLESWPAGRLQMVYYSVPVLISPHDNRDVLRIIINCTLVRTFACCRRIGYSSSWISKLERWQCPLYTLNHSKVNTTIICREVHMLFGHCLIASASTTFVQLLINGHSTHDCQVLDHLMPKFLRREKHSASND